MTRKLRFNFAVVALTVIASIASANAQMTRAAIGYSGISGDQLVVWVAKDTGIFAKTTSTPSRFILPAAPWQG